MNHNQPINKRLTPHPQVSHESIFPQEPEARRPLYQGPEELHRPFDIGPETLRPLTQQGPEAPQPDHYQELRAPHQPLLGEPGLSQPPLYQGPEVHQLFNIVPEALQPIVQQGPEVLQRVMYQEAGVPDRLILGGSGLPQPHSYQGPRMHHRPFDFLPEALQPLMQRGPQVFHPTIYQGPGAPHRPLLEAPGSLQPPSYRGLEAHQRSFDREPEALRQSLQQRPVTLHANLDLQQLREKHPQPPPMHNIYSNYGAFAHLPNSWIFGTPPQKENCGDIHPQSTNGRPTGAPVFQPPLQAQLAPARACQLQELEHPGALRTPNIHSYGNVASSVFDTPESNGNTPPTIGNNQTQPITQAAVETPEGNRNNCRSKPYGRTGNTKERTRIIWNASGDPIELEVPARLETVAMRAVSYSIEPEEMKRRKRPPENFRIKEFTMLFKKGEDKNKVREFLRTFNVEESNGDPPSTTSFSSLKEQECEKLGMELGKVMNFSSKEGDEMKKAGHSIAQRIIMKHGLQQLERVKMSAKSIRILLEAYKKLFAPGFVESHTSFYFNIMTHGFGSHGVVSVVQLMFAMTVTIETSEGAAVETRPAAELLSEKKVFQTISSRLDNKKCDVTIGEVRRRCEGPEGMPITYLRAILRGSKAEGYSTNLRERLDAEGIKTEKGKRRNIPDTLFSSLAEEDAKTLAKDATELLQSVRSNELFEHAVGRISVDELIGARCFLVVLSELAGEAVRWEAPCEQLINIEMVGLLKRKPVEGYLNI